MDRSEKAIRAAEPRNFTVFVVNQVLVRVGWIFKTETVVMPGFLDTLTPSSTVRGLLPLISRVGQSLPQFLIAHAVMRHPKKRPFFLLSSLGFTFPWFLLAAILTFVGLRGSVMVVIFLALYAHHWLAYGCTILANGTLQGKLIRAERRGRLLAYANMIGCALAILAVALLMPRWLQEGSTHYGRIFATTGVFFGLAALAGFFFREPPDERQPETSRFLRFLVTCLLLLRDDRSFRRFIAVILLYGVLLLLFPHYTVFGKRRLGLMSRNFALLVIVQNTVNALGSFFMGHLADRRGNRLVFRTLVFIAGCVPLIALTISRLPSGARYYWIVYAFLGFTPVSGRITVNYLLELAPRDRHPQYLGVLSLFQAIPLFASPLLGWLIDQFSFETVFLGCAGLIFVAGLLTFRLAEPRWGSPSVEGQP